MRRVNPPRKPTSVAVHETCTRCANRLAFGFLKPGRPFVCRDCAVAELADLACGTGPKKINASSAAPGASTEPLKPTEIPMIITVYALFNGEKQRVVSKAKTIGGLKRAASRTRVGNGWGVSLESDSSAEATIAGLRASERAGDYLIHTFEARPNVVSICPIGWHPSHGFFPCEILCKEGSK